MDELGVWGEEFVGFKDKVKYLAKEKGDNGKVAVLESVVGLSLAETLIELIARIFSFMEGLGFDKGTVGTILGCCPELFAASIEKTLKRKLDFLASIGVSKVYLPQAIKKYLELFVINTDRTMFPWVKYLMKKRLSRRDIAFMVWRFSPLLRYSVEEVLQAKLEFLVNTVEKLIIEVGPVMG